MRLAIVLLSATWLAGCAAVQVRTVGTNTGQAAFDLSGPSPDVLAGQARQLCPHGYDVMREWHRSSRPVGSSDAAAATAWAFTYDQPPDQAQMSIVCHGAAPA